MKIVGRLCGWLGVGMVVVGMAGLGGTTLALGARTVGGMALPTVGCGLAVLGIILARQVGEDQEPLRVSVVVAVMVPVMVLCDDLVEQDRLAWSPLAFGGLLLGGSLLALLGLPLLGLAEWETRQRGQQATWQMVWACPDGSGSAPEDGERPALAPAQEVLAVAPRPAQWEEHHAL